MSRRLLVSVCATLIALLIVGALSVVDFHAAVEALCALIAGVAVGLWRVKRHQRDRVAEAPNAGPLAGGMLHFAAPSPPRARRGSRGLSLFAIIVIAVVGSLGVMVAFGVFVVFFGGEFESGSALHQTGIRTCRGATTRFLLSPHAHNVFEETLPCGQGTKRLVAQNKGFGLLQIYAGQAEIPMRVVVAGLGPGMFDQPYGVAQSAYQTIATHRGVLYKWRLQIGDDVGFEIVPEPYAAFRPLLTAVLGVHGWSNFGIMVFVFLLGTVRTSATSALEEGIKKALFQREPKPRETRP